MTLLRFRSITLRGEETLKIKLKIKQRHVKYYI